MLNPKQSFRPYLTYHEIEALLECLATYGLKTSSSKSAYSKLFKLKHDAELGLKLSAYTQAPSLEEKLGIDSPQEIPQESAESLYTRWQANEVLSLEQISRAMQYKFEQGLMSPVEEMSFLQSQSPRGT